MEKFIIFLIHPFVGLIYSMSRFCNKYSYWVFAGFCILFGLSFQAVNPQADSYRYVEEFYSFATNPQQNLLYYLNDYGMVDSYTKDLYKYVMYYVSAIIDNDNYHVLLMLVSIVFTFFFLKSMKFVTDNKNVTYTLPFYILIFWFVYSNPIFNINGFRFWTASWIAVYAVFNIVVKKRYWYTLLLAILPLVHSSFVLFDLAFLVSFILKERENLWMPAFIISLFFSELLLNMLPQFVNHLPSIFQHYVWSYTESDRALEIISGERDAALPLYAQIMNKMPHYFDMFAVFLLIKERNNIYSANSKVLLGFLVFYYTCFNLMAAIPSVSRYFWTAIPMIVYIWVDSYDVMRKYNIVLYFMPLCYSYSILYWLRNMISVSDPFLFLSTSLHVILRNL